MTTCRPSLLACLATTALLAAHTASAGGLVSPAPTAATPATGAGHLVAGQAHARHFSFAPASLRELISLRLPLNPASLLPGGWEPSATRSYTDELHRTTIDLGLRHQFSGHSSAQVGARVTVLDCINIDRTGRFGLGDGGSRVHGLIGFSYRY